MPVFLGNLIAVLLVAGLLAVCIKEILKSHKNGGCGGCSGCSGGSCAGCAGKCGGCAGKLGRHGPTVSGRGRRNIMFPG